uniref:Lysosomal dipeptide transporter MFSD1 n=2 Tax=Cyprinus carpio TaxID=7962 RepID=A0A8C1CRW3_CYPCA
MAKAAEQAYYRFVVLFFNCMLTFGSYFCFDIPSVLQEQFQGNLTCLNGTVSNSTANGTGACVEGLGMTPQEYNLLYAIYAWTNAVVVIMAGFLIDKLGNRFGVFLFSFLTVLGSAIFALGSHFKGTTYLLPLMLTGRLLFGSGNGSLTIVQNRITAFWFRGKELALAFGLTLAFSRLGSVLNFFLTQRFESQYGMQWTLWGGTFLCVLGFVSAITVSVLDKMGMKQLGLDGVIQEESRKVRVQDVKRLSLRYWLLVLTIMFFYNGIFPFIADASTVSSVVFSVVCLMLVVFVINHRHYRRHMWPSIPLVVPQATLGTAMGLATSVQMIGIGISNLVVGQILGTKSSDVKIPLWRWQYMMIFMLANTISCIVTSTILNIVDYRQGSTLNKTTKRSAAPSAAAQTDREPLMNEEDNEEINNAPSINRT